MTQASTLEDKIFKKKELVLMKRIIEGCDKKQEKLYDILQNNLKDYPKIMKKVTTDIKKHWKEGEYIRSAT